MVQPHNQPPTDTQSHPLEAMVIDLLQQLAPLYLSVSDESWMHSSGPNAGTHFKIILVSERFANQSLVNRHKIVNRVLEPVWPKKHIHALSYKLFTPQEWEQEPFIEASPNCLGGGKL